MDFLKLRKKHRSARRAPTRRASTAGFTLLETLIGLVVGLVVIGAGVMVYSSNLVTTAAVAEQNGIEETARSLERLVLEKFSAAGYFGCQSRNGLLQNNLALGSAYLYNFGQPLYGWQSDGSAWAAPAGVTALDPSLVGASPAPAVGAHSDVLTIRGSNGPILPLDISQPPPSASATIWVLQNNEIGNTVDNGVAMITNCSRSTVFANSGPACTTTASCALGYAAGSGPAGLVNTSPALLGFAYGYEAEVLTPATFSYYIAGSQKCSAGAGGTACPSNSLYRKIGSAAPEELAENIQAMNVTYYIDAANLGSRTQAVTASGVADWGKVVGLRVDFLITSGKTVLPTPTGYPAPYSTWLTTTNKLAKRVVSLKIAIRNSMT